jgi:hypothetical protein
MPVSSPLSGIAETLTFDRLLTNSHLANKQVTDTRLSFSDNTVIKPTEIVKEPDMNRQITPGYDAFAKSEHQRMVTEAARARLLKRASGQPQFHSDRVMKTRTLWSVLNSKLSYAAGAAMVVMIAVISETL